MSQASLHFLLYKLYIRLFWGSFYALTQIEDTEKLLYSPVELFIFKSNKGGIGKGVGKEEQITVVSYSQCRLHCYLCEMVILYS